MNKTFAAFGICCFLLISLVFAKIKDSDTLRYDVSMLPEQHQFMVHLSLMSEEKELRLAMPAWMPGYYQLMNYAEKVSEFASQDDQGDTLDWKKEGRNTWQIHLKHPGMVHLSYKVLADRAFVANPFVGEDHTYLLPIGVCFYPIGQLERPVLLYVQNRMNWEFATGLPIVRSKEWVSFTAKNMDVLYDSPILIGDLKKLPSFKVKGIPHEFYAYHANIEDAQGFMDDLKKIVTTAVDIIGDIPYRQYTFIGIGPGQGGIEHLNSTTVSFSGTPKTKEERIRTLNFLTHEYFHHYNVKRIRPIELGPFDYLHPNRTKQLWISEGLTVYYEYIIMNRAGISSAKDILSQWEKLISDYEKNEGRKYQTLAESSEQTWEDGPFGKPGKTISYYQKGPIVGLLLDLAIREATNNRKSLDDVMRALYQEYYKKQERGFTEQEFWSLCQKMAGTNLQEIFDYVYTTKELDYNRYLGMVGLSLEKDSSGNSKLVKKLDREGAEASFKQWLYD